MTNELEKTFFDTFGIEPKFKGYSNTEELYTGGVIPCGNIKYFNTIEEMDKVNYWCFNMWELDEEDKEYPQITDRILLELICINNKELVSIVQVKGDNLEELKSYILQMCIEGYTKHSSSSLPVFRKLADNFKHQVRTLFEEG